MEYNTDVGKIFGTDCVLMCRAHKEALLTDTNVDQNCERAFSRRTDSCRSKMCDKGLRHSSFQAHVS